MLDFIQNQLDIISQSLRAFSLSLTGNEVDAEEAQEPLRAEGRVE